MAAIKNVSIKIHKTMILPAVLDGLKNLLPHIKGKTLTMGL
jgi:hypothetical protein